MPLGSWMFLYVMDKSVSPLQSLISRGSDSPVTENAGKQALANIAGHTVKAGCDCLRKPFIASDDVTRRYPLPQIRAVTPRLSLVEVPPTALSSLPHGCLVTASGEGGMLRWAWLRHAAGGNSHCGFLAQPLPSYSHHWAYLDFMVSLWKDLSACLSLCYAVYVLYHFTSKAEL